jgi:hypothetical protein
MLPNKLGGGGADSKVTSELKLGRGSTDGQTRTETQTNGQKQTDAQKDTKVSS